MAYNTLKHLYFTSYTSYRPIHSFNLHCHWLICIYKSSYLPNMHVSICFIQFMGYLVLFLTFLKFYFPYALLQYSSTFGRAFYGLFLCNFWFSSDFSHCLSLGKLIVGHIGLCLGLHLKTTKLHKNCLCNC